MAAKRWRREKRRAGRTSAADIVWGGGGGGTGAGGWGSQSVSQSVSNSGGDEENVLKTCLLSLKWREAAEALRLVAPLTMSCSQMNQLRESRLFKMNKENPNDPVTGGCGGALVGYWEKRMMMTLM